MSAKTKYEVRHTSQFKKDYRQAIKRKLELSELHKIVDYLANGIPLPPTMN